MADTAKLVIRNISVPLDCNTDPSYYDGTAVELAKSKVKRLRLGFCVDDSSFAVFKKSVDARSRILFTYSIIFSLSDFDASKTQKCRQLSEVCEKNGLSLLDESGIQFNYGTIKRSLRPVIVGFGPCGMFAALILARAGFMPIVIERGSEVDKRCSDVDTYWKTAKLNVESNVQFGEGGAGTFSDGKLMTRINDRLCAFVLEVFHSHGADAEILFNAKPHVGTDKLRAIVKSIRKEIISLGGEVFFDTCLTDIKTDTIGRVTSVVTTSGEIQTDSVFLAVGHSARDTFCKLLSKEIDLVAKPFSVGVRIEHLQKSIDKALYGRSFENPALPRGEYSLSRRYGDRAVYSFCMCPGGTVVASASEQSTIVTNGMSYSARNGANANSAIAVSVGTDEFSNDPVKAMEYQRSIEKKAFALAGNDGTAPIQNVGSFLGKNKPFIGEVRPTYTGKVKMCDLQEVFPREITSLLRQGISFFENRIEGFSADDAILTAPETRTSSPIRITRSHDGFSTSTEGLYPIGEGAGYAGGITSAAVDGIKAALLYIEKSKPLL